MTLREPPCAINGVDSLNALLVALVLESVFYGIFIVAFTLGCTKLLAHTKRIISRRHQAVLAAHTVMFLLATAHFFLTVSTTLAGFNSQSLGPPFGPYPFNFFGSHASIAQFYIYVTQTLISDGFMVYRLFVVWGGSRCVLIVPVVLCFLDAGFGVAVYLGYNPRNILELGIATPYFVTVFFAFSLITNVLTSGLIMWRIVRSSRLIEVQAQWHSRACFALVHYRAVFEAIIQSAAIYSTASIVLVSTCLVGSNAFPVCLSVFPQIIGVVFSGIVLKIAQTQPSSGSEEYRQQPLNRIVERPPPVARPSAPIIVRPLEISISQAPISLGEGTVAGGSSSRD